MYSNDVSQMYHKIISANMIITHDAIETSLWVYSGLTKRGTLKNSTFKEVSVKIT